MLIRLIVSLAVIAVDRQGAEDGRERRHRSDLCDGA
jgi:hypothetical protein